MRHGLDNGKYFKSDYENKISIRTNDKQLINFINGGWYNIYGGVVEYMLRKFVHGKGVLWTLVLECTISPGIIGIGLFRRA